MRNEFVYPFLFASYPIIFLYSYNICQVSFGDFIVPLLVTLLVSYLLFVLFNYFFKNKAKSGLVVTLLSFWFFLYGHFFNLISGLKLGEMVIGRHRYFFVPWNLIFLIGVTLAIKTRRNLYKFTPVLNRISLFLILFVLFYYTGFYNIRNEFVYGRFRKLDNERAGEVRLINEKINNSADLPDIYYIILDSYASFGVLKDFFYFDNSEFYNFLIGKGFYIADKSRANYPMTFLSLASSLNLDYLDYLSGLLGRNSNHKMVAYRTIQDNKVWHLLKSKGYKFVNIGSWYYPTTTNNHADYNFSYSGLNMFSNELLLKNTSVLGPIQITNYFFSDLKGKAQAVNFIFNKLADMPHLKNPKFIFVHIPVPHDLIFNNSCQALALNDLLGYSFNALQLKDKTKRLYLFSLTCINTKIKLLIDKILADSNKPPIIILQGDHGPFLTCENIASGISKDRLNIRTGILNAYYFPAVKNVNFYESLSPVNSFRLLFNVYFNTRYELLEDRCYIFKDWQHPYNFFDVTEKLKENTS